MPKFVLYGGIGLVVVILIVVIVSVVSGSKGKKPATTGDTASSSGKTVLTWWHPLDSPDALKPIIDSYMRANPTIEIKLVQKQLEGYEEEATNALAAGEGPDIWSIPNAYIPKELDKLSPAPDGMYRKNKDDATTNLQYVQGRFVPLAVRENVREDKVYGLPLYVDTLTLFVNKSLLGKRFFDLQRSKADIDDKLYTTGPRTWNEFVNLVTTYTVRQGDLITKPAVALGRADNVHNAKDIVAALMLQNGATLVSPDGITATFNIPITKATGEQYNPGKESLGFFLNFSDPKRPEYTWNSTFPSSYEAFRDEQVAMIIDYADSVKTLKQEVPNFKLASWPLPQIQGEITPLDLGSYWTETVPKTSKNVAQAWAFVRYLTSTGQSQYLSSTGRSSSKKPPTVPKSILLRTTSGNPQRFQSQSAAMWYRGRDPQEFERIFTQMIQLSAEKPSDIQKYLDGASNDITKLLRLREGYTAKPRSTPEKKVDK